MARKAYVRCPYCGCSAVVEVEDGYHQRTVVTCDIEEGSEAGCGRDFVADITVKVDAYTLKIEGEEDKT